VPYPKNKNGEIIGNRHSIGPSFLSRCKDHLYIFFTAVVMVGMMFAFLDLFARSADVQDVQATVRDLHQQHDADYQVIDQKLDRILYHILDKDSLYHQGEEQ
jgi:hypothetical protein